MRGDRVLDLADCTEFRLALEARPPRLVHGTVILVSALVGAALLWAALTEADLVVRAAGRVRPGATPTKVFSAARGEAFSASPGGRVLEVHFREGDEVRRGDVLLRLDAERLDNEIAKHKRAVRAGEEELAQLARLGELSAWQFEAARAKAEAELAQAREAAHQAKERQAADVRLARVELEIARDEEARLRRLVGQQAAAMAELVKAVARLREAKERLERTRLPVDEGEVEVLRRALAVTEKDHALRGAELVLRQGARQAEVEAARLELANLELERRHAVLRAPLDGVVTAGDVKVGDLLEAGKPVVEIAAQAGFRFEMAVPGEEVGRLRVGMPARIKLDAYDYQRYGTAPGTVCFIAPDSSIADGRQTTSYLVRIELAGEEVGRGDLRGRVKLGMAGRAEIVTEREGLLALLLKRIRQSISLG
jgi:HlyD family type I secretion membrane fusion protein